MTDYRFQHRRTTNPASTEVLLAGEWGVELDGTGAVTGVKMGDGTTDWASLPFIGADSGTYAVGHVGATDPEPDVPPGTEFVWFKTDGAGTLLDILTGVAD